jgi:hypothetical protein
MVPPRNECTTNPLTLRRAQAAPKHSDVAHDRYSLRVVCAFAAWTDSRRSNAASSLAAAATVLRSP